MDEYGITHLYKFSNNVCFLTFHFLVLKLMTVFSSGLYSLDYFGPCMGREREREVNYTPIFLDATVTAIFSHTENLILNYPI